MTVAVFDLDFRNTLLHTTLSHRTGNKARLWLTYNLIKSNMEPPSSNLLGSTQLCKPRFTSFVGRHPDHVLAILHEAHFHAFLPSFSHKTEAHVMAAWTAAAVISIRCILMLRLSAGASPSVETPLGIAEGTLTADGVASWIASLRVLFV